MMAETVGLVSPLNRARFVREIGPCSCTRSRTRERLSSRGVRLFAVLSLARTIRAKPDLAVLAQQKQGASQPSCHESARRALVVSRASPLLTRASRSSPLLPAPPPPLPASPPRLPSRFLSLTPRIAASTPPPRGASELLMSASQSPLSQTATAQRPSRLPRSKLPRFGGWAPTARTSVWRNVASPLVRWKQGARGPLGVLPARTWRSPRSPLPRRRKVSRRAGSSLLAGNTDCRRQRTTSDG